MNADNSELPGKRPDVEPLNSIGRAGRRRNPHTMITLTEAIG